MKSFFDQGFWNQVLEQLQSWFLEDLPSVLALIIACVLVQRLFVFLTSRLEAFWRSRLQKRKNRKVKEEEKRINTLATILRQALNLLLLGFFFISLMGRFGIDIMPLIAGAGVVGLAIGFGAQELVRDIISGFFLLIENQIRTGDVAIINGTTGMVERMDLRTITLRDLSGTVHIFQNGKINTLIICILKNY